MDDKTDHDHFLSATGDKETHRNNLDEKYNIFEIEADKNSDEDN